MSQWDIIGHQKQLQQLEHDFQRGNLSHAYLAAGPSQIGKFSIMKRFAHILQCAQGFCRHCSTCLEIAKGYHADTLEMINDGESIKIETMRELLAKVAVTAQSPYKIVLIKDIERMTPEAANALLKTLEDPPPRVKFLLTTSRLPSLLSTIISRVRLIQFSSLPEHDLVHFLQNRYPHYSEHTIRMTTNFALGKIGKALAFLENSDLFQQYQNLYDQLSSLLESEDRIEQFRFIADIVKEKGGTESFLAIFLTIVRQKLLESALRHDEPMMRKWIAALEQYQKLQEMFKRNVNERLLLENLMFTL